MAATHNFKTLQITSISSNHSSLVHKPHFSLKPPKNNPSFLFGTTINGHQNIIPTISRRLLLPSVSGLTGGNSAREAVIAIGRGMLLFRQVGRDSRPVRREAYSLFKDGGDPEKLVTEFSNGSEHEYFYSFLYAGLYYESQNDSDAAKGHIIAACKSPYGSRSDEYMASLAKVHCDCRNWSSAEQST